MSQEKLRGLITLNVIIERADLVSVMFQESECVVIAKVLKLDECILPIPSRNEKVKLSLINGKVKLSLINGIVKLNCLYK